MTYFNRLLTLLLFILSQQAAALTIIRDSEAEEVIAKIARPIFKVAAAPMPRIIILQDNSLNAFVSGRNQLFIHSGLIARFSNPAVLAGVIAHECAHIQGHHISSQQQKMRDMTLQKAVVVLGGGLIGAATGNLSVVVGAIGIGSTAVNNSFISHMLSNENTADQNAIRYLKMLNTSNEGLALLLKQLEVEQRINTGALKNYPIARTHPMITERIRLLNQNPTFNPSKPDLLITPTLKEQYAMLSAKIMAFTQQPNIVLSKGGADNPSKYASSIALFRQHQYRQSQELLDGLARSYPKNPYIYELKGLFYLKAGLAEQAIANYQEALDLSQADSLLQLQLAMALLQQSAVGHHARAINLLQKVVNVEPQNLLAWRQLAIAYGRSHNNFAYHIALAKESYLHGNQQKACKFLVSAAKQSNNPKRDHFINITYRDLQRTMGKSCNTQS